MAFTVAALRETAAGERRVAITPETARKWQAAGALVLLETAAGLAAGFPDEAYPDVIFTDAQAVVARADILLCVQPPSPVSLEALRSGSVLLNRIPFSMAWL